MKVATIRLKSRQFPDNESFDRNVEFPNTIRVDHERDFIVFIGRNQEGDEVTTAYPANRVVEYTIEKGERT